MPRERDEGSGQYTERYPPDVFLDAIRDIEDGFAGTSEIAEQVGCSERLALLKLNRLADKGRIRHREIGRSSVWFLTEEDAESIDRESTTNIDRTNDSRQNNAQSLNRHHAAVHEMYQHLRKQTTATEANLSKLINFELVSNETKEEFVLNCLNTLRRLPSVAPPDESGQDWRFIEQEPVDRLLNEPTTEAFIAVLNEGYVVVVETEFLGERYSMRLRLSDGTYYCETPVNLHRHETEQGMRACIEKHGHADAQIEAIE